jgi:tetratricopeptide (TPR) repeat protein
MQGDGHRHLGNKYGDLQEYWAGVEDYTRATVLDPSYAEPYYCRGVLYWREIGNHYRAIQDLTRVMELDPTRSEAYLNRGLAYKLHGESEKAIADLEQYLAKGKDRYWLEAAGRQLAELRDEPGWETGVSGAGEVGR